MSPSPYHHALATAPTPTSALAVSWFTDPRDAWPKLRPQPWSTFAAQLQEHDYRHHKAGPAFSPARYPFGARRGARFVEALSMLPLDFDGPEPPWELLGDAGLTYAAYTTWSHWLRDESHPVPGPRWRVVLPLAEDVPAAAWPGVYAWALQEFPGADPVCRDAGRVFFLPACPLAPPVAPEVRFRDTGLSLRTAAVPPTPLTTRSPGPSGRRWAAQLLRDGAPQGSRNAGCFQLAAYLWHFGLPEDVVSAICSAYAVRCRPPLDLAEVRTVVANVCWRYEPGREVAW